MKKKKLNIDHFTISGNGKQVRDLLYVSDCVDLYILASQNFDKFKGLAFNIGGGVENSCSILELLQFIEKKLNIKMNFKKLPVRESDQKVFIADLTKVKNLIGWKPKINKTIGLEKMINWIKISF